MKKRVVITGLGAVSPLGIGHQNFWENICAGKNGITDIDYFDVSNFSVKRGGEIKNFDKNIINSAERANFLFWQQNWQKKMQDLQTILM